ncbi:creatininase family protein [Phycisphaerales bacterium AB-hyl4]|uniref:Creatininase family protein n=1 Tax=Natronomicrosphaera hydrolytica TaxID=3242702 RepID=A0ABV4U4L2_9BACT
MKWQEQTWPSIAAMDKATPVVIPLGSIEQHGHHMPLCTDTVQVTAIAERAEAALGERAIFLPPLWLGSSHHHLDFAGTLSLKPTLYTQVIQDLATSVLQAGFRRLFFLNGHGGNETPVAQALTELSDLQPMAADALLAFASWWSVGKPDATKLGMQSPGITHACEYETSLMLHLRPDLVKQDLASDAPTILDSPWLKGEKRVTLFRRFSRMTATGSLGQPTAASEAKGASVLEAVSADVVAFVSEFASWSMPETLGPR